MNNTRLNYYDVLKAYAIILVVLYHFGNNILPGGYLGVDIFFVINGFLLARSIDRIADFTNWFKFLSRRLLRLYPVVLVAVFFCLIWGAYWLIPHSYKDLAESVFATLLFANNVLCYIKASDYWAVVNDFKPLMHTWYLAIIVQFYVCLPLFIVLLKKTCFSVFRKRLTALPIMVVCFLGSLLINFIPCFEETVRFYFLPFRLYEFCYGYLIAQLLSRLQELKLFEEENSCFMTRFVTHYGSLLLYAAATLFIFYAPAHFSVRASILITVILSGLFLFVLPYDQSLSTKITNNRHIALIGRASFSIYIWHQIVLAFYRSSYEYNFTNVQILGLMVAIAGISAVSYRCIECPIAAVSKDSRTTKWINCTMYAGILLVILTSLGLRMRQGVIRDVPELDIYVNNIENVDHNSYNESAHQYNKGFQHTGKVRWLVVGDSFGRDWLNVLRESKIEDEVELSYVFAYTIFNNETAQRAQEADLIFFAMGTHPDASMIDTFYQSLDKYGIAKNKVYITGGKRFGYSVNQVYSHRNESDYPNPNYSLYVKDDVFEINDTLRSICGERFIDLYAPITVGKNRVRAFDDEGHILSQDSVHLTKAGAGFYAKHYRELILNLLSQSQKQKANVHN